MLKVVKFGGSSLADACQFAKVKRIVEADEARRVVVVSAPGKRSSDDYKITDLLYLCAAHIKYKVSSKDIFDMIRGRYQEIASELHLTLDIDKEFAELWDQMQKGMTEDELASRGEYFSARLMADYLGFDFIDAAHWVKFNFDGTVNQEHSYQALTQFTEGHKVVIPGFYGVMPDGRVHTFTRGGSDVTGALAAAALKADVYENWTDVSGILMADPRVVKNPQPIKLVTYSELRELSYMGASVLHDEAIFPVREANIPLNIRNTNEPENTGTTILEKISGDNSCIHITGIAGRKGMSVISISKVGMSSESGALLQILDILAKRNINVEYIPSGIDSISIVVSSERVEKCLYEMLGEIQKYFKPDKIAVTEHIATIAVVSRKISEMPQLQGIILSALGKQGINIKMVVQGADALNVIIGIEENVFEKAMQAIYNEFVKE